GGVERAEDRGGDGGGAGERRDEDALVGQHRAGGGVDLERLGGCLVAECGPDDGHHRRRQASRCDDRVAVVLDVHTRGKIPGKVRHYILPEVESRTSTTPALGVYCSA